MLFNNQTEQTFENKKEKMTKKDLDAIKKRALSGMKEFLKYCDGNYLIWDVWKVEKILNKYYKEMALCSKNPKGSFTEIVKTAVLALNDLNEKCDFSLIETDQREDICEFIIKTAYFFNFIQNENEDITGEWRDW